MSDRRPEYARIRLALAASALFGGLPAATLDALASAAQIERYERGGCVDDHEAPQDKLWFVLEGGLIAYYVNSRGETTPLSTISRGSFYNTASLVEGGKRWSAARAERGTVLAAIPGPVVRDLSRTDPEFALFLTRMLLRRFQATLAYYADAISEPLPVRLARRLLGQAVSVRDDVRPEIDLSVSQADLARMLGASRSKLNTELRKLEDAGVLRLGYGKIQVTDLDRLGEIAGGPVLAF